MLIFAYTYRDSCEKKSYSVFHGWAGIVGLRLMFPLSYKSGELWDAYHVSPTELVMMLWLGSEEVHDADDAK